MTKKRDPKVDVYIRKLGTPWRDLLIELRELIFKAVPDAIEQIKWNLPVYSTETNFCYLSVEKSHVTLGFYDISGLDDPEGRLENTGKKPGYVRIETSDDIHEDQIIAWLQAAARTATGTTS